MSNYRRNPVPGGTFFFTVTLADRQADWLVRHVDVLREVVKAVRQRSPFLIDAWVVLPEHIHAVWTLPHLDNDYPGRWREIKKQFSKMVRALEGPDRVPDAGALWQRRYWEHTIRNERDYRAHIDYAHFNPVKHGWVDRVVDWPYSTFHRAVKAGWYPEDWGGKGVVNLQAGE
ncbi:REP-associated tyrosine transposase [Marinimicrobium agarilyticum]|uniref:REP-associated tyrosine transposase n=1 Tax=Marinimicrobium agarilyticum TaxID=306546 RepID=UPI0003F7CB13|nr:transposase [Marinimicrobium agarilyticum]